MTKECRDCIFSTFDSLGRIYCDADPVEDDRRTDAACERWRSKCQESKEI